MPSPTRSASSPTDRLRAELAQIQDRRAALEALSDALTGDTTARTEVSVTMDDAAYKAKRSAATLLAKEFEARDARLARSVRFEVSSSSKAKAMLATLAKDITAALAVIADRAVAARELSLWITTATDLDLDVAPVITALGITDLQLVASAPTIARFAAGTYPTITSLFVRPRSEVTPAKIKRLLEGKTTPALRSFAPDLGTTVLKAVIKSPLASQLETLDLDLAGSDVDAACVATLVAAKPKLKKLTKLVIRSRELEPKHYRSLFGFCAEVIGVPDEQQLAFADREQQEYEDRYRYEEITE